MRHRVQALLFLLLPLLLAVSMSACNQHAASGASAGSPPDEVASDALPVKAGSGPASPTSSSETDMPVTLQAAPPHVTLHTSMGDIVVELFPDKAPKTVENFLGYAREGFYNDTVFHRVIDDLLIQGGGYSADLQKKPAHPPIGNEANNGLSNQRGTISAARGRTPSSETSEFFINLVDNPRFDYTSDSNDYTWGYTVFGKVISGMDVVDKIRAVKTHAQGKFTSDVPIAPVVIKSVEVMAPATQ